MAVDESGYFTRIYFGSNKEKRMMLFFESGKVTQVRVYENMLYEDVKNSFVVYSNSHFKKNRLHFLEKEFYRDGKLINEHYTDGVMEYYFETEHTPSLDIVRGFSNTGSLFYFQTVYKNNKGKPYASFERLDDEPGFFRRINSSGAYSEKSIDTLDE